MNKFLKKYNKMKNQKGFSLVELMVVVAIIGILAAIAIPNYQKFQARSRQSEAKLTLSGLYTAQKIFASEWNYLSADLGQIGFALDGTSNSRYRSGWAVNSEYPGRDSNGYNGPVSSLGKAEGAIAATNRDKASTAPTTCSITTSVSRCRDDDLKNAFSGMAVVVPKVDGQTCLGICQNGAYTYTGTGTDCAGDADCTGVFPDGKLVRNIAGMVFTIGSTGDVGGSQADQWWIDNNKRLVNTQNGVD